MDIWLVAVLVAWLPVATSVALLLGRSLRHADLRDRRTRRGAHCVPSQAVALAAVPALHRQRVSS